MPADHLRLVTDATTTEPAEASPEVAKEPVAIVGEIKIYDLNEPLQPNYEAAYRALLADQRKGLVELRGLRTQVAEANRSVSGLAKIKSDYDAMRKEQAKAAVAERESKLLEDRVKIGYILRRMPGITNRATLGNWASEKEIDAVRCPDTGHWLIKPDARLRAKMANLAMLKGVAFGWPNEWSSSEA
jgi:hypothetical protein